MQIDLTKLSAGGIAVLTVFGSIAVAVITATGASVTACISGYNAHRLEYVRAIRQAKTEQAQNVRETLNERIKYYLEVRKGRTPPHVVEDLFDESTFFPVFLAVDKDINALSTLANEKRASITKAIEQSPANLPADTIKDVNELLEILIVLNHFVEISLLEETIDPTAHSAQVRADAKRLLSGRYNQ